MMEIKGVWVWVYGCVLYIKRLYPFSNLIGWRRKFGMKIFS